MCVVAPHVSDKMRKGRGDNCALASQKYCNFVTLYVWSGLKMLALLAVACLESQAPIADTLSS